MQDVDVQSERIEDVVKDVEDVVATAKNVEGINAATIPQISKNDVILAQTLIEIKAAKPKAKSKGLMVEPEMPLIRKDQIAVNEEVARGLEAEWNANIKDNIDWNKVVEQVQSRQSDARWMEKGVKLQERNKKKKVEKDQPAKKKKEIVHDDEDDVFMNVTHLSSKPPTIMDYKIYKEGKKEHFQIFRANGNHQMYLAFSTMLKNFNKEDLEVLWKIVKDRFKKPQPKEVLDVFLWHTLKVIEMKSSHKAKIEELERRVKKLEEENKSLTKELKSFNTRVKSLTIKETVVDKEESSKQGRKIADIDVDADVNLENVYNLDMDHKETVLSMQDVDVQSERIKDVVKDVEDVVATAENVKGINVATIQQISKDDVTLTQTLIEIKVAKPKAKVVTMQEPSEFRTILPSQSSLPSQAKDKGKGVIVEPKMPLTRKDQIALDKEVAIRLEADWNADMKENIDWNEVVEQVQSRQSDADNAKKQKLEEQKEAEELKKNLEIVPDDEDDVFVNVTPLSSKPPTIMDYKIYKEGKNEHFKIFRANGNHQMYLTFSTMFKNFDREDLEVLWKIVKDMFKKSQPKEVLDVFLWHTLKIMFEHNVEDNVWKHQKGPQGLAKFKLMLLEERLLLLEDLMIGKEEVNTASIPTASTQVSPVSANVAAASISLDTACAYIASQSNGSQIKLSVFFLQALEQRELSNTSVSEMDLAINANSVGGS
nr:hypothetical protein [Tanacetum cinerariifolium]